MLKLRIGLVLSAVLLCDCNHHKNANQAQAEAGTAAVAHNDSDLTGEAPTSSDSSVPSNALRATAVTLPDATTSAETKTAPGTTSINVATTSDSTPTAPAMAASKSTDKSAPPLSSISNNVTTEGGSSKPIPPGASDTPVSSASSQGTNSNTSQRATNQAAATTESNPATASDTSVDQQQVVVLETPLGRIVIQLDDFAAPRTCANFRKLVSDGFYNHTTFHRVIPHFVIQGGDPNSKSDDRAQQGLGGPEYRLPAEIKLKHDRGAVAMARLPDSVNPARESNGSQFYICLVPCPSLDDQYTVFGHVIKGLQVANDIAVQPRDKRDNPLTRIEMQARLESKDQALEEGSVANP